MTLEHTFEERTSRLQHHDERECSWARLPGTNTSSLKAASILMTLQSGRLSLQSKSICSPSMPTLGMFWLPVSHSNISFHSISTLTNVIKAVSPTPTSRTAQVPASAPGPARFASPGMNSASASASAPRSKKQPKPKKSKKGKEKASEDEVPDVNFSDMFDSDSD